MRSLYRCPTLQVGPHVMFYYPCIISSGISITCVIAQFVSTISADHDGKPHTYVNTRDHVHEDALLVYCDYAFHTRQLGVAV